MVNPSRFDNGSQLENIVYFLHIYTSIYQRRICRLLMYRYSANNLKVTI